MNPINDLRDYAAIAWLAENEHLITSGQRLPTKCTHQLSVWGQTDAVLRGALSVDDPRVLPEVRQAVELKAYTDKAASEGLALPDYCAKHGIPFIDDVSLPDGTLRTQPLDPVLWGHVSAADKAWPYSVDGDSMAALEH